MGSSKTILQSKSLISFRDVRIDNFKSRLKTRKFEFELDDAVVDKEDIVDNYGKKTIGESIYYPKKETDNCKRNKKNKKQNRFSPSSTSQRAFSGDGRGEADRETVATRRTTRRSCTVQWIFSSPAGSFVEGDGINNVRNSDIVNKFLLFLSRCFPRQTLFRSRVSLADRHRLIYIYV